MNPGGVRADLVFDSPPGSGGEVTYGEAFAVQPFNNIVTTQSFTGAQLLEVLKDQWCAGSAERAVALEHAHVHLRPVRRSLDRSVRRAQARPTPCPNVRINGTPLSETATYRVTTNNFLADGGDSFASLRTARTGRR